jgi:heat-inducible transcriptional repressor
MITELNERSRKIFQYIVDAYLTTGAPVGSKIISEQLGLNLSSATIRNVMAELEETGLLCAPHTSAGRMPTQTGLRLYVDGLMEIGDVSKEERKQIEAACSANGHSMKKVMEEAGSLLSGLSAGAGLVFAPKTDKPLHQIQFVQLDLKRVLAVLVMKDGMVENRIIETSNDLPASALVMASNYLNEKIAGKTIEQAHKDIKAEIAENKAMLDKITIDLVEKGLALAPDGELDGHMIIRGQSRLLQDLTALEELEKARALFEALEEKETLSKLLSTTQTAKGVQIYIGTENKVFDHAGWSMILSPYQNKDSKIIGAIGVIGPTRLNYGRIIPIVDYTSKVMTKIMGET